MPFRKKDNLEAAMLQQRAGWQQQILSVTKYRIDDGVINYRAVNGTEGSVNEAQVNWRKTTELASRTRSADGPMSARQTN